VNTGSERRRQRQRTKDEDTRKPKERIMAWATVASDLHQLGNSLSADIIGWGAAVIGIALTASAVLWVLRILRS
jgi:hypothetical protein